MDSGRGDKVLVFHFKRKKQYKKIFGHRQPFTSVRITEIEFNGQKFAAPEMPAVKPKAKPVAEGEEGTPHKAKAHAKHAAPKESKPKAKAAHKAAKKPAGKNKKK
jgi:large subunit ribosomal protein L21